MTDAGSRGIFHVRKVVTQVLNTLQGMSLLTIVEIVGPILLGLGIAYGVLRASRRPKGSVEKISQSETRQSYRQEDLG
jgi:hypothetical protein